MAPLFSSFRANCVMNDDDDAVVVSFLSGLVTENRLNRLEEILAQRTKYITVALEDIYQSQNASAVLRTCECFGIMDIHIIENYNTYSINPMVLQGADKWLNIKRYSQYDHSTGVAVSRLKSEGYRIVATSLNEDSIGLDAFDISGGKFVVVFGNEHQGVSEYMLKQADERLKVSMCGFTQSLNISVSAGIIISQLTRKIRNSAINWQLTEKEKESVRAEWLKRAVKNSQMLLNYMATEKLSNKSKVMMR